MPEPSVGDLLSTARRHAEQLLYHAEASDALALAAGWRHVLDSASAVLAAMPTTGVGNEPPAPDEQYLATRVAVMAASTRRLSVPAAAHPGMVGIADALTHAADLVGRHAGDGMTRTPAARADLEAARVQIARTLAAGAHAVSRELRTYAAAVHAADQSRPRRVTPRPISLPQAARWVQLAQDQEQVALDYATRRPWSAGPEQAAATGAASRLDMQLARWSTTVIRHAAEPQVCSADLHQIAAGQAWALRAATGLTLAAAELVQVHRSSAPVLLHRLQDAAAAWSATADNWSWMTTPDRLEATPAVLAATSATIATVNGVLRAHNAWATPAQIAAQLENTEVTQLLATVTETSHLLAGWYEHLPAELSTAGRLRASARALLELEKEHHQRQASSTWQREDDPSPEALSVNLRDVAANRLLPLTPTARQVLHEAGVQLTDAAHAAHAAVSVHAPHARAGHELTPSSLRRLTTSPLPAQPPPEGPRRPSPGPGLSP